MSITMRDTTATPLPLVSIIVPCYNESDAVEHFRKAICEVMRAARIFDFFAERFESAHGLDINDPDALTLDEVTQVSQDWLLRAIRTLVRYLGIGDGNMEEGSLRCDANVSVRKISEDKLRTRCEIKNLNSIRHVMHAIQHEAERHVEIWEKGGTVDQEFC